MKKLKNLGRALNKAEQKEISGGKRGLAPYIDVCGTGDGAGLSCSSNEDCCPGLQCTAGSSWRPNGDHICY
jgi:hypothetical protein